MTTARMRVRTIVVLVLVVISSLYCLNAAKAAEIRRYNEFRAKQALWMEADSSVEDSIKGYIDDIDWGSYIEQFVDALANPGGTVEDLYEYYGAKDVLK